MNIMGLLRRISRGTRVSLKPEPLMDSAHQRGRELAQLEREKQLEIEEAKRRIEWIENEKAIIQREQQ